MSAPMSTPESAEKDARTTGHAWRDGECVNCGIAQPGAAWAEPCPAGEAETEKAVIHEPRCNTYCVPGTHHLSDGIGFPHIHRTDLAAECGECAIRPASDGATKLAVSLQVDADAATPGRGQA